MEKVFFDNLNGSIDCKFCTDEITKDNYVLYTDHLVNESVLENNINSVEWKRCIYCSDCIVILLNESWNNYLNKVKQADCASALKRLIDEGPPINLKDPQIEC